MSIIMSKEVLVMRDQVCQNFMMSALSKSRPNEKILFIFIEISTTDK